MKRSNPNYWLYKTKKPDGTCYPKWRIKYRAVDGGFSYATGYKDKGESERRALQLAVEADEIRRGARPAPTAADTESLRPIREHLKAFLAAGRLNGGRNGFPWSEDHARRVESDLEWWIDVLKLKTIRGITLPAVSGALQSRKGLSGKTLFHISGNLRSFVNWCRRNKYLVGDPLEGLGKFSTTPKTLRRPLTQGEIGKLIAAAPPERALLYRVAIVTGFRAGELESLRVGDLDVAKGTLFLRAAHAKDRRDAVATIPTNLAKKIEATTTKRPEESPLFPWFRADHAARTFHLDRAAAGIPATTVRGRLDFHALRTTHVNLAFDLDFDAKTAQTLARHKDANLTLNTYARANPDRLRKAVEKLDQAVVLAVREAPSVAAGVQVAALPLAAGAESLTHPPVLPGDASGKAMVEAGGIAPPSADRSRKASTLVARRLSSPEGPGGQGPFRPSPGKDLAPHPREPGIGASLLWSPIRVVQARLGRRRRA